MTKRIVYSRAERTVREKPTKIVHNKNYDSSENKIKLYYNQFVNYIKAKLGSKEEIDPRDEIIKGIEARV